MSGTERPAAALAPGYIVKAFGSDATEDDIKRFLDQNGIPAESVVRVFPYGGIGVGKSFLCNRIVSRVVGVEYNLFGHATQASSCTRGLERVLLVRPSGKPLLVYNMPGMIEEKQELVEENRLVFYRAAAELAMCPTGLMYVRGAMGGGRGAVADVTTYHEAKKVLLNEDRDVAFVYNGYFVMQESCESAHLVYRNSANDEFGRGAPVSCFFHPKVHEKSDVDGGHIALDIVLDFVLEHAKVLTPNLSATMILTPADREQHRKAEAVRIVDEEKTAAAQHQAEQNAQAAKNTQLQDQCNNNKKKRGFLGIRW